MSGHKTRDIPPNEVVSGGEDTFWTHGDKHGFATPRGHDTTPIWFTLTEGAMTEVRYPRIDMMNTRTVEFVIADPETGYTVRTYHEYQDQDPEVNRETAQTSEDALLYEQRLTPTAQDREWELTVEYAIHPEHDAVLLDVEFEATDGTEYDLYVMTELMLSCCGRHDIGNRRVREDGTVALTGYHTGDTWDDPVIVDRTEVEPDDDPVGTGDVTSAGKGDQADSPERTPAEEEDEDEPIGSGDVTSVGVVDSAVGEEDEDTTEYEETPYHIAAALTSANGFSWGSVDINGGKVYTGILEDGEADRTYERATDKVALFGRLGDGVTSVSDTVALGLADGEGDDTDGDEPTAAAAPEPGETTATTTGNDTASEDTETTSESTTVYDDPGEDPGELTALEAAEAALEDDFETVQAAFAATWESYVQDLDLPESVVENDRLRAQYKTAVMTVKAADSKAYPGAGIASPSVPWGDKIQADEPADYGYSYVWARDLYGSFTAFEAMGDIEAAIDATEYIYEYQQRDTGFLPQNTFIDGRTRWGGEQMDEIAFPAVMAQQLKARHGYGFDQASYDYDNIAKSAEYVATNGPRTQQERWEEEGGYSPSTTAAEIAGLVSAADLADDAGERADALAFLGVADYWQENIEDWMATTTGAGGHENTPYYFRISEDGQPDTHTMRTHNNAGGTYDEREVIDGGFLELVRLGVKDPNDPVIQNSLVEYDDTIHVETPNGPGWYRYSGDGYGEKDGSEWFRAGVPWATDMRGEGRLWPIFTGERGEYELLRTPDERDFDPQHLLETLQRFATDSGAMPEQVWDRDDDNAYGWQFGEGTSAATPLCWTNAQYIRLAHSIDADAPIEMPEVVRDRYVEGTLSEAPSLSAEIPTVARGGSLTVTGETDAAEVVVKTREETVHQEVDGGSFDIDVTIQGEDRVIVAAATDDPAFDAGIAVEYMTVEYERPPKAALAAADAEDETVAEADSTATLSETEPADEEDEGVSS